MVRITVRISVLSSILILTAIFSIILNLRTIDISGLA